MTAVHVVDADRTPDESVRADASPAEPRPSWRTAPGTVTAGSAAPLNDGAAAIEPHCFGLPPGEGLAGLDVLELNAAFAAQVLGCPAEWPEFDPGILSPIATLCIGAGQGLALVLERQESP